MTLGLLKIYHTLSLPRGFTKIIFDRVRIMLEKYSKVFHGCNFSASKIQIFIAIRNHLNSFSESCVLTKFRIHNMSGIGTQIDISLSITPFYLISITNARC